MLEGLLTSCTYTVGKLVGGEMKKEIGHSNNELGKIT